MKGVLQPIRLTEDGADCDVSIRDTVAWGLRALRVEWQHRWHEWTRRRRARKLLTRAIFGRYFWARNGVEQAIKEKLDAILSAQARLTERVLNLEEAAEARDGNN
jgi:hypothetical protein